MYNYLLKVDIKSNSGQLLRASDFHFKTRKEAAKSTVKIVWLISGNKHILIKYSQILFLIVMTGTF